MNGYDVCRHVLDEVWIRDTPLSRYHFGHLQQLVHRQIVKVVR